MKGQVYMEPKDAELQQSRSEKKRELLALLLAQEGLNIPQLSTIKPAQKVGPVPLSFAQQRLWFLEQLQPGSTTYSTPLAVCLHGHVNIPFLERSFSEIIRRHDILHTTFVTVEGQPTQVVQPPVYIPFSVEDLTVLPDEQKDTHVLQLIKEFTHHAFDIERGPLVRIRILRLNSQDHILLLNMHHIISDEWSMKVFVRELGSTYSAFTNGHPTPLANLSIQYADYALWQRQWLQGQELEKHLSYWKNQLKNVPTLLALPIDHPRPVHQSTRGASYNFSCSADLGQKTKDFSHREEVSLFMTFLAAFNVLLYRYTGQEDIVIGSPITNRTRIELEDLIGFFVNTLALRTSLCGPLTFHEVVQRVREVTLNAYAHQDVPFEIVVEAVQPQRSLSHTPLFQAFIVFQNDFQLPHHFSNLQFTPLPIESDTAKFDLLLSVRDAGSNFKCAIEYNTDLFHSSTIERMAQHFQTLLGSLIQNPQTSISAMSLIEETEKEHLLNMWQQQNYLSEAHIDAESCLHYLFEAQVQRTPDAIALITETTYLTYSALNQRANMLAYRLRHQGVGPEIRVAVCLQRDSNLVIVLLAILKAGGTYVPLDPDYPAERLLYIIQDAQVHLLLIDKGSKAFLPVQDGTCQVIQLDTLVWEKLAIASPPTLQKVHGSNLAYVIYTSGSTGQPKGVGVTHHNSYTFLAWVKSQYQLSELANVLALTSVCFDLSIFELLAPLSSGGTSIVMRNVWDFLVQPLQWPVTLINTVPSVMRKLLDEHAVPSSVITINLAGEPLPLSLAQQIYNQTSVQKLYNCYGPTEDTTYSTWAQIPRTSELTPPIGQPIAYTQAYILDETLQPVPVGIVGEIYLGGNGIARGYLNHPEITAERFVPHPYSSEKGARLYRTGDLARLRVDDQLEYVGRRDQQVKLRGFRIELGEIEATLNKHEAVQASLAMVMKDKHDQQLLISYVVLKTVSSISAYELRQFCKEKVPTYLIPSIITILDEFLLTPNGKIDYSQLPQPKETSPDLAQQDFVPQTDTEQKITAIWQEMLHLEKVGLHDNFFDLGGHSLLVLTLQKKLLETFDRKVPIAALFQYSNIHSLAEYLCQEHPEEILLSADTYLDLDDEVKLDASIYPEGIFRHTSEPAHIFLTGATGFIGAFLLWQLLEHTNALLYCLVRSPNLQEGEVRLQRHLQSLLLWNERYRNRIIPIPGNLNQPLLGLTPQRFDELAQTIEVIYHNGAQVNFLYPYHMLKATNVLGTQEVLRLACLHKVKPLHYISTTSVFDLDNYPASEVIDEQRFPTYSKGPHSGYPQSKWVAEKLVTLCQARGLPVAIYRIGNASGHSETGVCNRDDLLYRELKACIQLGMIVDIDTTINIAPIDYVSKAIFCLSQQPESRGKFFHLVNPSSVPWNKLIDWFEILGYPLKRVSPQEWSNALTNKNSTFSRENALQPLATILSQKRAVKQETDNGDFFTARPLQFDCQNTLAGLKNAAITCPQINAHLLATYFSYLTRIGYLPVPQKKPALKQEIQVNNSL